MKLSKPNVLILVDWFTPGFRAGGPIRSVSNLVESMQSNFNFFIITSNKDLGAVSPYDVEPNVWLTVEQFKVYYSDEAPRIAFIKATIQDKNINAVYFNSLFSKDYTIVPLKGLKRLENCPRLILAPRGMLSSKALGIKRIKKSIFLLLAKWTGLYDGITWHATSTDESIDIKNKFKKSAVVEAPNLGVLQKKVINVGAKISKVIHIISISRISRIKNIHLILESLEKIPHDRRINYTHVGPIEDVEYWQECLLLKNRLSKNVSFRYAGEKSHVEISQILMESHLLMLLSDSENFGHVVLEAFAHGVPCIVSNGTPWKNLSQRKIGFNLPIEDIHEISAKMTYLCDMAAVDFEQWSVAARKFAEEQIGNEMNLKNYLRLFSGD